MFQNATQHNGDWTTVHKLLKNGLEHPCHTSVRFLVADLMLSVYGAQLPPSKGCPSWCNFTIMLWTDGGVARKYINPDNLQVVAVGDVSKIKSAMEKYGPVEIYDAEGKKVGN